MDDLRPAVEEFKIAPLECEGEQCDEGTVAVVTIALDLVSLGQTVHVGTYCRTCADDVTARLRKGGCV